MLTSVSLNWKLERYHVFILFESLKRAQFGDSSEACKQLFQFEASTVRALHIRLVQHLNTLTTLATL